MAVATSTRKHLDDHLGQAEFALKVAVNFECLKGTPAHDSVRAALAQVASARTWVREKLQVESGMKRKVPATHESSLLTRRELVRATYQRMRM